MGLRRTLGLLRWRLKQWRAARHVQAETQVLHGPARVDLADDQCAAVSLMKDAEYWVGDFIRHHQALGVAHIVILDNGSSDQTVEIAQGFDQVTVLRNTLPVKQFECQIRTAAARKVLRGGWVLFADSDEMAEVPGGALTGLLKYCNVNGFTAVVSQMLDLYAPMPLSQTRGLDYAGARAAMTHYSLGALEKRAYHDPEIAISWFLQDNQGADGVQLLLGGLRREIFHEDCLLTKHSLVRNLPGVQLMTHPHAATGVRVADVTVALRHYKLAGDFAARDRATMAAGTWEHNEDQRRVEAVGAGDFIIAPAAGQVYAGPDQLVRDGFLTASDAYWASLLP